MPDRGAIEKLLKELPEGSQVVSRWAVKKLLKELPFFAIRFQGGGKLESTNPKLESSKPCRATWFLAFYGRPS